jgi:hypothetical protein
MFNPKSTLKIFQDEPTIFLYCESTGTILSAVLQLAYSLRKKSYVWMRQWTFECRTILTGTYASATDGVNTNTNVFIQYNTRCTVDNNLYYQVQHCYGTSTTCEYTTKLATVRCYGVADCCLLVLSSSNARKIIKKASLIVTNTDYNCYIY